MLNEGIKNISAQESKKNFDKTIKGALALELQKMKERNPERNDAKFRILKQFVLNLENQSFEEAFDNLNETEKHAIITRLQNQSEHMGGKVPYDFIYSLERDLYGVIYEEGEMFNLEKKAQLEDELQSEN